MIRESYPGFPQTFPSPVLTRLLPSIILSEDATPTLRPNLQHLSSNTASNPLDLPFTMTFEPPPPHPTIAAGDHKGFMSYALDQARLSPPASTKFCVGAVLVDADKNEILSTGYSLELPRDSLGDPGSTHAEQCCFIKVAQKHSLPEERIGQVLPKTTVLYTTMEPCNKRLSGNRTCVERILRLNGAIKVVYVGIKEPEVFVGENVGRKRLEDAGVVVTVVEGMQDQILKVSTAGHEIESK